MPDPSPPTRRQRLSWTHPDWRPWRWYAAAEVGTAPQIQAKGRLLSWTHPDWRPWRWRAPLEESIAALPAVPTGEATEAPGAPRRIRLHWTHPDWRPWRRTIPADQVQAAGTPGVDLAPVVEGIRLVKLPWSHPNWRPWRRYVPAEQAQVGGTEVAIEGALEILIRPHRIPWGRIALFLGLIVAFGVAAVQGRRIWRRHMVPGERAEYLLGVAQIYLELEDHERAIEAAEEAHRLQPQDTRIVAWMADLLTMEDRRAETEELLDSLSPEAIRDPTLAARRAAVLLQRQAPVEAWQAVAPTADALLQVRGSARTRWLLIAGSAALEAGAFSEAEALLSSGLKTASEAEKPTVLGALGRVFLLSGRPAAAIEPLEQALRLHSGNRELTLLLARGLAELGRFNEALERAQSLLVGDKATDPAAVVAMGELHLMLGEREAARAIAAKLGESPGAQLAAATIRARAALGDRDLVTAERESTRILELDSANAEGHRIRIALARASGDQARYRAALDATLKVRPDLIEVELARLDVECLEGEWSAVEDRAVRLAGDPRARPRALQGFALAFSRPEADPARALARLDELRTRWPADPLLRVYQALFALLAGKDPEGKALADLAGSADLASVFAVLAQLQMGRTDALESVELISELVKREARFAPARIVLATFYERLGRSDLARKELDAAIQVAPTLRQARLMRAQLALRSGAQDVGIADLLALPQDPLAITLLAEVRLGRDEVPETLKLLQRACELAPNDGGALVRLARGQTIAGQHAQALKTLEQARQLAPALGAAYLDGAVLLDKGDLPGAENALRVAAETTREPRYQQALAAVAGLRGDRVLALDLLQKDPNPSPERAVLRGLLLAECATQSLANEAAPPGTPAEVWSAVKALPALSAGHPPHPVTKLVLETYAYLALGWSREAARRAEREGVEQLDAVGAWWSVRVTSKQSPRARELLERLVRLAPSDTGAWSALALLRRADGLEASLSVFDAAKRARPDDLVIATRRGMLLDELGRREEARLEYERAVAADRFDAVAMNNLACFLGQEPAERPRAIQLAREALARFPQVGLIHDTVGWLLHQDGQSEEALKHLSLATALVPSDPRVRIHLAEALSSNGELLRARNHLRIALWSHGTLDRSSVEARLQVVEARIAAVPGGDDRK